MPNYCDNTTVFMSLNEKSLIKIKEGIEKEQKKNETESLAQFIMPIPDSVKEEEILDWKVENWGTKWGDCSGHGLNYIQLNTHKGVKIYSIYYHYDTAWCPFDRDFFGEIIKKFKDVKIINKWEEEDGGIETYEYDFFSDEPDEILVDKDFYDPENVCLDCMIKFCRYEDCGIDWDYWNEEKFSFFLLNNSPQEKYDTIEELTDIVRSWVICRNDKLYKTSKATEGDIHNVVDCLCYYRDEFDTDETGRYSLDDIFRDFFVFDEFLHTKMEDKIDEFKDSLCHLYKCKKNVEIISNKWLEVKWNVNHPIGKKIFERNMIEGDADGNFVECDIDYTS